MPMTGKSARRNPFADTLSARQPGLAEDLATWVGDKLGGSYQARLFGRNLFGAPGSTNPQWMAPVNLTPVGAAIQLRDAGQQMGQGNVFGGLGNAALAVVPIPAVAKGAKGLVGAAGKKAVQEGAEAATYALKRSPSKYRENLGTYADTLYHEGGLRSAETLLPSNIRTDLGDLWFSNNPDHALGQGGQGFRFTFDANGIDGHASMSKPTAQHMWEQGVGEFRTSGVPQDRLRNNLQSVVIAPNTPVNEVVASTFRRMEKQGWVRTQLPDGSVQISKPR